SREAELGAARLVGRLGCSIKSGDRSRVLDMAGGDLAAIQVHQIFEAARNGDGVSISVVRDTARYVGMAIANLVAIADPDVVVVGGLIADAADQLLQPSQTEALRRLPKSMADALTVTAFCPTTVACRPEELAITLEQIATARVTRARGAARVLPAHLESNFINPDYKGAQPSVCLRLPNHERRDGQFSGNDILGVLES